MDTTSLIIRNPYYALFTKVATRRALVAIDGRAVEEPSFRDVGALPADPRRTVPLAGRAVGPGQSLDRLPLVAEDNELLGIRLTGCPARPDTYMYQLYQR